jgi:Dyp-type peroxidase family
MSTIAPPPAVEVSDVQGLVARSYSRLKHAAYVAATFDTGDGGSARARQWVGELAGAVTPAARRSSDVAGDGQALNLAFTADGVRALGLPEDAVATFSREFQEGMAERQHRSRALGDTGDMDPEAWRWGGPNNAPVHAMLFLFAGGAARLEELLAAERARASAHGVTLAEPLGSVMLPNDKEHFGFHDGIAQPRITGLGGGDGQPAQGPEIPAGEVVLGYPNAYGKLPLTPTVAETPAAGRLLPEAPPEPGGTAPHRRDLGRNGSYLAFRQLEQDVRGFWSFADQRSGSQPERRKWLASKMVGRWPNGAPLVHHADSEPAEYDPATANDFLYTGDLAGDRCPVGSHVRRCNPRDGMQPNPEESLLVADRHRLLRRGRAYGPPLDPQLDPAAMLAADDPAAGDRGLHFICFNSDLVRQFEFVQNTWVNNMKFDGLYQDPDALIAPHVDPATAKHPEQVSSFTVQRCPVRHRETGVPRFVTMRGGAYLFMPGIRALKFLAAGG